MIQDSIEISDDDENIVILKETIDEMSELLDFISYNAFRQIQIEWIGNKTYLIQGQELDAARHTLLSIWRCAKSACFSDAFTLVRKFRDDLVQYLFITSDAEKVTKAMNLLFEILSSGQRKKAHEKAVDSWLENTLSDDEHFQDRQLYFDASEYIAMLEKDHTIKSCFESFLKPLWVMRDRELNNFVHANGSKYIMSNLPNYIYDHRKDRIMNLVSTIRDIMTIFTSLIILIKPSSIQSTDYVDCLDVEEVPPEGSQYWVAPIIQSFIDSDIVRISSGLKQFLKENNRYGMQIE